MRIQTLSIILAASVTLHLGGSAMRSSPQAPAGSVPAVSAGNTSAEVVRDNGPISVCFKGHRNHAEADDLIATCLKLEPEFRRMM